MTPGLPITGRLGGPGVAGLGLGLGISDGRIGASLPIFEGQKISRGRPIAGRILGRTRGMRVPGYRSGSDGTGTRGTGRARRRGTRGAGRARRRGNRRRGPGVRDGEGCAAHTLAWMGIEAPELGAGAGAGGFVGAGAVRASSSLRTCLSLRRNRLSGVIQPNGTGV